MRFVQHTSFKGETPKVQQRRHMPRARTQIVDVPDLAELQRIVFAFMAGDPDLQQGVLIPYGVSTVHPEDQFCRKIGFHKAADNVTVRAFFVKGIQMTMAVGKRGMEVPGVIIWLTTLDEKIGINIAFSVPANLCRVTIQAQDSNQTKGDCGGNCGCQR